MDVFQHRFRVRAPLDVVSAFHQDARALKRLTPPPMLVRLHRFGGMEEGMIADFTLWLGPIPIRWTARHEDVRPDGFVDVQVAGPMARWRHQHRFVAVAPGETEVHDRIEYAHRSGPQGMLTRMLFSKPALQGLFAYRTLATRRGARHLAKKVPL